MRWDTKLWPEVPGLGRSFAFPLRLGKIDGKFYGAQSGQCVKHNNMIDGIGQHNRHDTARLNARQVKIGRSHRYAFAQFGIGEDSPGVLDGRLVKPFKNVLIKNIGEIHA